MLMSQNTEGASVMIQGRIVWVSGDLWKGKPKIDQTTKLQKFDKQGNPAIEYGFGLAVPKAALGQGQPGGALWAAMHEETYKLYPSRQLPPGYAWKYKDGDGVDHNGQPFGNREGHAQHLIFAMTTSIPIKYFKWENGQNILISEGIKCGDYVNVQVTVKAHPPQGQGKAGLYLNPNAVQFLGFGKEIVNTPSGDQIFGQTMPAVPQGASALPLAPQGNQPIIAPAAPAGFQPSPDSAPQVTPHFGVVPPAHQPPLGGVAMAAPPMPPMQSYPPQQQTPGFPPVPR